MCVEHKLADALRVVAMRLEDAIERGYLGRNLTPNDLRETLLSIADQLDPPVPASEATTVEPPY
jgi:hypothetical protein